MTRREQLDVAGCSCRRLRHQSYFATLISPEGSPFPCPPPRSCWPPSARSQRPPPPPFSSSLSSSSFSSYFSSSSSSSSHSGLRYITAPSMTFLAFSRFLGEIRWPTVRWKEERSDDWLIELNDYRCVCYF